LFWTVDVRLAEVASGDSTRLSTLPFFAEITSVDGFIEEIEGDEVTTFAEILVGEGFASTARSAAALVADSSRFTFAVATSLSAIASYAFGSNAGGTSATGSAD
jgi:Na+/phosphate symporter